MIVTIRCYIPEDSKLNISRRENLKPHNRIFMRLEVLTPLKINFGLLVCNIVGTCRYIPTFWRNILPGYSRLKMEAICFCKMLLSAYKSSGCYNPEDQHRHVLLSPVLWTRSRSYHSRLICWRVRQFVYQSGNTERHSTGREDSAWKQKFSDTLSLLETFRLLILSVPQKRNTVDPTFIFNRTEVILTLQSPVVNERTTWFDNQ
jgi:hypothetical protein